MQHKNKIVPNIEPWGNPHSAWQQKQLCSVSQSNYAEIYTAVRQETETSTGTQYGKGGHVINWLTLSTKTAVMLNEPKTSLKLKLDRTLTCYFILRWLRVTYIWNTNPHSPPPMKLVDIGSGWINNKCVMNCWFDWGFVLIECSHSHIDRRPDLFRNAVIISLK